MPMASALATAELRAEAIALRAIAPHPHIIRLVTAIEFPPLGPIIVTELCSGGSLAEVLHQWAPVDLMTMSAVWRDCARQVSAAVAHLHAHQPPLVHGDIATRNLLVVGRVPAPRRMARVGLRLRLADFGLSGTVSPTTLDRPATRVAVRWAAPEVLSNERVSTASDVWALGVTIWEIFSGARSPYADVASDLPAVVRWVRDERRTLSRPPACDHAVWAVTNACFAYDAILRPPANTIEGWLRAGPVSAALANNAMIATMVAAAGPGLDGSEDVDGLDSDGSMYRGSSA